MNRTLAARVQKLECREPDDACLREIPDDALDELQRILRLAIGNPADREINAKLSDALASYPKTRARWPNILFPLT